MAATVERYDRTWSRFRDDSLVSRIAREPGVWRLPAEAGPLLDLYRRLYDLSDGAVSPLVGRRLETMGYDRGYSLRPKARLAPVPRWEDALAWDGETLTTPKPVLLDVGAAGKGQLVDLVAAVLRDAGVDEYTVDASGDLAHAGRDAIRVGLEHPLDAAKAIGVIELRDRALAASATNRRAWGADLHHVLDATTGSPVRSVAATWAVADTAMLADGMATALFVTSVDRLRALDDVDWVRMRGDGTVDRSPGVRAQLFTSAAPPPPAATATPERLPS